MADRNMRSLLQLMSALMLLMPAVIDDVIATTVTQSRGENVTLTCASIDADDQLGSVIWFKEDTLQVSKGSQGSVTFLDPNVDLEGRLSLEDDHSLVIDSLQVSDTSNYTCKIFVIDTTTSLMVNYTAAWELVVQDVPSPPGKPIIQESQARQVTVTWSPSNIDNNSPIQSYLIQIRDCQSNEATATPDVVVQGSELQAVVPELLPFTCYRIQVQAQNAVGLSPPGQLSDIFYTESEGNVTTAGPPSAAPDAFQAISTSSSEITITWQAPRKEDLRGDLVGYWVTYGQREQKIEEIRVEDPAKTSLVLQGLDPHTWYTVSIFAYNGEGDGPKAELAVQTQEGLPSRPRITHITGREATSFYVHWEPPKKLNGKLTAYELLWILDDNTNKTRIISGHLTNPMSAFIAGLRPYTEYKIQVAAVTGGGRGRFSEKYPALTDVAAPSVPFIRNVTVLSPSSVFLQWDPPTVFNRRIDKYVLKYWDTRGNDPDQMVSGKLTQFILRDLTPNLRYNLKLAGMTQAIFSKRFLVGEFTSPVQFALGVESLDESKIIRDYKGNDNHPHDPSIQQSKDEGVSKEIIAGVTCGIAIIIIVAVIIIGYRSLACQKCYQAAYYYLAVPSSMQSTPPTVVTVAEPSEEKVYPEISVPDFPAHVETMHADSDFGFAQEFEDLYRNTRTDFKCEASNMPDNRNKNRYINIAAFDHSRVMLKMDLGRLKQSDYINANYVDGYQKSRAYIATQGPLPQTFQDFWRMVWEQNCSVIVMITNLMEKGRRKCDQYWPNEGLEIYGGMSVKLLSTVQRAHYTVNIFSLRNMKVKKRHSMKGVSERTVYQYHYTEWPDHGVPDYTLPVLEFVQKSAAHNPPTGGPIIVHCSAGVGRTGTYILIDSMIRQIADRGTVNIPGFTLHIRRQRNLLVQTEDQYTFIHEVLVEYLMGGGQTEVTDENIIPYVQSLTAVPNGDLPHYNKKTDTSTTLETQYKLATSYRPHSNDMSCALKPVNSEKNRSADFVPVNLKRVILPARPGIEGSEYINATYLQGYRKSEEFIVTQYPMESTKEDFWRMVWDRNSPVIIVLLSYEDEDLADFWPEKDNPVEVDAGNFKLSMREDPDEQLGYTTREFILESIQYDYVFMTKVVTVTDWTDSSPPQYSVFSMIELAIDLQRANDIGPVIIMDRYGGVRAGRFCALWGLRDQLILDKEVDVYQLVKLYHLKRPGIVGSQDDLRYLYEALACLKEHLQEDGSISSASPTRHHTSSIRKNGTLPRSSTLQNNTTKNETNI